MDKKIIVEIFSFGFKYYKEHPPECDLRIDLRNKMKNPQSHLPKGAIGKDKIVIKTVLGSAQNKKYIDSLTKRIKVKLTETNHEIFTIGIGCRSGIHRSVVVADFLFDAIQNLGLKVTVSHLNLKTKN